MPAYQSDPYLIKSGGYSSTDAASIVVAPGTGNVQVQIRGTDDLFFTPADASYTLDAADVYLLPRRNRPEVQLIATGTAQFYVIGA